MPNIDFDFNLTITQGDDRSVGWVFDDGVEPTPGPIDISLWEFFYTAKSSNADPDDDALIRLEPSDFTASDSGTGTIDRIDAVISVPGTIAADSYPQDLQVKKPDGSISTIGIGQLVVQAQTTQRTS